MKRYSFEDHLPSYKTQHPIPHEDVHGIWVKWEDVKDMLVESLECNCEKMESWPYDTWTCPTHGMMNIF